MAGKLRGWILDTIWKFKVNDGTDRTIFDENGYLYQRDEKITASAAQTNGITYNSGTKASGLLNVSGVVADTQTVTIGEDVYEVEQVNTDTEKLTTSALDISQTNIPIATGHGVEAGDVILVDASEFMYVTAAATLELTVIRGWGLAAKTHVDAREVFKGAGYTAERIPVPMNKTTLTAESFINHFVSVHAKAKALGMLDEDHLTALKQSAALLAIIADAEGDDDTATTETGGNMDWGAATLLNGSDAGPRRMMTWEHTVTAQDVTNTAVYIYVEDEPVFMIADVRKVDHETRAWNGGLEYEAGPPQRIKLDNGGNSNLTDTDVIRLIAYFD